MLIRDLRNCQKIIAGDHTVLRELLHPDPGHDPDFPRNRARESGIVSQASGNSESCPLTLKLRYSLAHATVLPGRKSAPHRLRTSEVYYILGGKGIMHINDEQARVAPGQTIYIPPNARQFITAVGRTPLRFLCIVDPAWRKEDERVEATKSKAQNPKPKQNPKSK
jgi:mannose-6-phosphate isomerase-like protein (cupin superfamily)